MFAIPLANTLCGLQTYPTLTKTSQNQKFLKLLAQSYCTSFVDFVSLSGLLHTAPIPLLQSTSILVLVSNVAYSHPLMTDHVALVSLSSSNQNTEAPLLSNDSTRLTTSTIQVSIEQLRCSETLVTQEPFQVFNLSSHILTHMLLCQFRSPAPKLQ